MSMATFSITPMGAVRTTRTDLWRPAAKRYYKFKDDLALLAVAQNYAPTESLSLTFCMPMPPSWSKKKRVEMLGKPHQQKPDIDNLMKAFLDALCAEDCFIHTVSARKIWGVEGSIEATNIE